MKTLNFISLKFQCEPTWNIIDIILSYEQHYVFELDSLTSYSHPLVNDAESPEEAEGVFDSITYSKGASINRMQMNFLTQPTFLRGLTDYLSIQ
ncbi:hypothetical protein SK128_000559 [Halocaridina rubra]|uniref:Peptidase M1 membrane alanine aminopeptidase domain-containing protein n=1 Tax=Halocaridina rubra TaxID=373956 RepID=A0AAN9A1E0_HALRR